MPFSNLPNPEERIVHSLSPEARRQEARELHRQQENRAAFRIRALEIVKRVAIGTYNDGFIHAGNLAYLSMLAIFPFFVLTAAVFSAVGESGEKTASIYSFLAAMPAQVREVIEPVARNVIEERSGWLLWAGAAVALWTVGSLVETIRDILRRAYGTQATQAFWKYRLVSAGIVMSSVVLLLLTLFAQVLIGTAQEMIDAYFPAFNQALGNLRLTRLVTALGLYLSIYMLFYSLTPTAYRDKCYPKWPGALAVTVWWMGVTVALPPVLRSFFSYDLTYGSLAGMMISLFFFWLVGLGVVLGAELNAALAETPEETDGLADVTASGLRDPGSHG